MSGRRPWAGGLLALVLAVSCSNQPVIRQTGLTVSTRADAAPAHDVLGPVSAEYCDHVVLLLFPVVRDQREAWGRLIEQARGMGGDALADFRVRLRDTAWVFPLYMKGCWQLQAEVIRYRD